jgi:hypothetical protein
MADAAVEQAAFLEVDEVAEAQAIALAFGGGKITTIRYYRCVPDIALDARVEKV